jgi:signal transduction histidine kinase
VTICLKRENSTLSLEVVDDGIGFNPTALPAHRPRGLGLLGMRERMAMIDGALQIESGPGRGTRVWACAPLTDADQGDKNG